MRFYFQNPIELTQWKANIRAPCGTGPLGVTTTAEYIIQLSIYDKLTVFGLQSIVSQTRRFAWNWQVAPATHSDSPTKIYSTIL
jgi:hypothetical protein